MVNLFQNSRIARILLILVGIAVVYITWDIAPMIYKPLHISSVSIRLALRGLISFIPMTIFLLCLHKPKEILKTLGLNRNICKGIGFAVLCCSPLLLGMPIIGTFDTDLTFDYFFRVVVLAAFLEEVIFRGFMFGQLFRCGKVGFIWAIIVPAILFGLGHLYQGHNLISSLMAFGVTALGALYFSWVYVECNYNLWVSIGLHMFMNFSWTVFPVEGNDTSIGVLLPNILRLTSIVLTIALIIIYKKKSNNKLFRYPILQM